MKQTWIQYLVAALLVTSCNNNPETVSIRVQFENENPDSVGIVIDPIHNLDFRQKNLHLDSAGSVEFDIGINKPSMMMMGIGNYLCFLIIQPGDDISITFCGPFYELPFNNDQYSSSIIEGSNSLGQVALNKACKRKFAGSKSNFVWDGNGPDTMIAILLDTINKDLEEFKILQRQKSINKDFYSIVSKYVGYKNASYLAHPLLYPNKDDKNEVQQNQEEQISVLQAIFDLYPINNEDVLYSFNGIKRYINQYLLFQKLKYGKHFQQHLDAGSIHEYELSLVRESVPPIVYERFAVDYLWGVTYIGGSQEDIEQYESFIEEFPNCRYEKLLRELNQQIEAIKAVNDQAHQPFPKGTKILEAYQDINSFEELLSKFENKKLYIDFWATWCGPCLYDHQCSGLLEEFAEKHEIQLVYVSVDNQGYTEKWENYIKYHNLIGYHLHANSTLVGSLKHSIPDFGSIPRYVIVNENGEVVDFDAKRPSEGEELLEQLTKKLKI